ncbi:MAG: cardiolipin synthase ClsB [Ramlibacter sp.]|nr:cardiolipin synthase ClsB [Ramlibacter sp.]
MSHTVPPMRRGHSLRLLQGSVDLFPAMIEAFDAARREVRLETYIFDFTGASAEVAYALERAARRGVSVKVVVDGFGTEPLPPSWQERFLQAGVDWRVYSPLRRFGLLRLGNWRRLHRKLCVVDGELGFCGGINILDDFHDPNHGLLESPRLDFAVGVTGPLVADILAAMDQVWRRVKPQRQTGGGHLGGALVSSRNGDFASTANAGGDAPAPRSRASLVLRDNVRNRTRIERSYRRAIGRARSEIIIANAYFVPGGKMRKALLSAARRGVKVQLLLQGRYEYFMQYYAARPIYGELLAAGIEIHEYAPSFLHAKVAVFDRSRATVGSSNLDPLSLLLAREANVAITDEAFTTQLRERLLEAIRQGRSMQAAEYQSRSLWQRALERIAHGLMRLALAVQGKTYL